MRTAKWLLGGILLVVLVGVVAGAGLATAREASGTQAFVVPVGQVGDRVSYTRFERGAPDEPWKAMEVQSLEILEIGRTMDEHGLVRDVATARWAPFADHHSPSTVHVDLVSRDMVRRDQLRNPPLEDEVTYLSDFGPHVEPWWIRTPFAEASFLRFQGSMLAPGDEGVDHEGFALDWGLDAVDADVSNLQSEISSGHSVDGRPALQVRIFGTVRFTHQGEDAWSGGAPFLSFVLPAPAEATFSRSYWFVPDSAYPVAILDEVIQEGKVQQSLRGLVAFQPGADAIPWGASQTPRLAFDPGQRGSGAFPADGSSSFCYLLSEAVADVESDSTLVGFQSWREAHPTYFLVSANGGCRDAERGGWNFIFAAANGDAWMVGIINFVDDDPVAVWNRLGHKIEAEGEWRMDPFDSADLPDNLITLAVAEAAWRAFASPDYLARGLNNLRWGIRGALFSSGPGDPLPERRTLGGPESLRFVVVGTVQDEQPAVGVRFSNWSHLALNLETGELVEGLEGALKWGAWADHWLPDEAQELLRRPPPAFQAESPSAAASAPSLTVGAVLAGSLLAALAAAYFYPLLKVLGTQAATLLPGYAKIRRDALLDHRTRETVVQMIRSDPGVSPPELHKRLTIGWSTLVYHLGVLEKNKLVSSLIDGRHKRMFPVENMDWGKRPALAVLRNQKTKQLFQAVFDEPGISQKELVGRIGLGHAGGHWHLDRLEKVGLLVREKRGHKVHYYPNERDATQLSYDARAAVEVA